MRPPCSPPSRARPHEALNLMRNALELLDQTPAPGQIGATLDLALGRLEAWLGRDDEYRAGLEALVGELERELAAMPATSEAPSLEQDQPM